MVKVVIINKSGVIKESKLKKFTKADLYKKCGFRKDKDFKMRAKWKMNDGHVEIYAKGNGRAGSENKEYTQALFRRTYGRPSGFWVPVHPSQTQGWTTT